MSRVGSLLVVLLLLVGCRGVDSATPFAESRVPPNLAARFFPPEGWAWGYVQAGNQPAQRYGVASTSRVPAAQVVILPGYGESAEVWFETVADLTDAGYTVWVLERAGQGGSGRYTRPHDLGFVPSFEPDVRAFKAFLRVVVRPSPDKPLIVMTHADGAVVALRAAQSGVALDGLILSSPHFEQVTKRRIGGLDRRPGRGWRPWNRSGPDAFAAGLTHDPTRGGVGLAWQTANPDLRMSGASHGWTAALGELSRQVMDGSNGTNVDHLMIQSVVSGPTIQDFCEQARRCRLVTIAGARGAMHLEADRWRAPWITTVKGFIADKAGTVRQPHKQ